MPSTRRAFVVSTAALLAGCVASREPAGTPEDPPTGTPTRSPTAGPQEGPLEFGEAAVVGELEVRPSDADVMDSYLALVYPDFADVVAPEGRRFLFVHVTVDGPSEAPGPPVEDFSIVAGETVARGRNRGSSGRPYLDGGLYAPDRGEGWTFFELPAPLEAGRVALELDDGGSETAGHDGTVSWRLPEEVTERLRAPPPAFEVRDFQAPTAVGPDEPIEVSATVENVGEGAGTFRGSLNQEGDALYGAAPFSFELAAGEEREWTERVTTHLRGELDSELTVRLRFRSAGGDFDRDVTVRPGETTTG